MKTITNLTVLVSLAFGLGSAVALDIVATTEPIVTGSGTGMTARYENVATHEGVSLDLFAEMLSYSPDPRECLFTVEDDDIKFQFRDGVTGMERNATIRWTFFENGTTNPVTAPSLVLTVDDLDNLPTRQESLSTSAAIGFDLNDPTNVTATLTGSTVDAAGGIEQNSGDPEGAVRLHFANISTFEISYRTIHGSALVSAYHHDGDGDFTFPDPEHTPVGPPFDCSRPRLYYTYNFNNDGFIPILTTFSNKLPDGMVWDTQYTPGVTGGLQQVQVIYEKQDREALIPLLMLPPGDSTLTLCTFDVDQVGLIENDAKLGMFKPDPPHPEDPPHPSNWHQYQTTAATITLDPLDEVSQFICNFKSSQLCQFAWLVLGTGTKISSQITGQVGVGPGGDVDIDKPQDMPTGLVADPGATVTGATPTATADLSAEKAAALALNLEAQALTPTQTLGAVSNANTLVTSTAANGMNVISMDSFVINAPGVNLTIQGSSNDFFIFNIAGNFKMNGGSGIVLDGVNASNVLFNILPGGEVDISGQAFVLAPTLLAPTADVSVGGGASVLGSIISGGTKSKLHGGGTVNGSAALGGCEPCCGP